jgi:tetratricopeptide (TPR) repeat protein
MAKRSAEAEKTDKVEKADKPEKPDKPEKDTKARSGGKAAAGGGGKPAAGKDSGKAGKDAAPAEAEPAKPIRRTLPLVGEARFGISDSEPAVKVFSDGLAALYRKDWAEADKLLGEVAERRDMPELAGRARQLQTAARQKAAEAAPPSKAGDAEAEDPYLGALFEKNRGQLQAALDQCQKDGRDQQDERFAYLAAAIHATENRIEDAARVLTRAIELNPKNRIHAYHDPDFAELRRNRDHRQLFGLS